MSGHLTRLSAKLVHATTHFDRAYLRYDRLRSLLVLAFASDAFLEEYCRRAYNSQPSYDAHSADFRSGLFGWEERTIRRFFPPAPARVLVGGAGGGREVFGLIETGYSVVAFDPARGPLASMLAKGRSDYKGRLDAYFASYEDLPVVPASEGIGPVDLRQQAPFDAAIFGWCSFSHLLHDSTRIAALAAMGQLTRGPILVSYFWNPAHDSTPPSGSGLLSALRRRALRRESAFFAPSLGYARNVSVTDMTDMAGRGGLEVVHIETETGWPHAILRARER